MEARSFKIKLSVPTIYEEQFREKVHLFHGEIIKWSMYAYFTYFTVAVYTEEDICILENTSVQLTERYEKLLPFLLLNEE